MRSAFCEVRLYIFFIIGLFVFGLLVTVGGIFLSVSDKKARCEDKEVEKTPSAVIMTVGVTAILLSVALFVLGTI